jgi:hypothetical protein
MIGETTMKIMEFQYTKSNGDISDRTLAVLLEPHNYVEGIDISGLDNDEFVEFTAEYSKLQEKWKQDQLALFNKFDLKHNYRRFIPENMSDVMFEYV